MNRHVSYMGCSNARLFEQKRLFNVGHFCVFAAQSQPRAPASGASRGGCGLALGQQLGAGVDGACVVHGE
jgi:hypothetical protein